jgi:hypothetical protein
MTNNQSTGRFLIPVPCSLIPEGTPPTPPLFIFKTLQIISPPEKEPRRECVQLPRHCWIKHTFVFSVHDPSACGKTPILYHFMRNGLAGNLQIETARGSSDVSDS